MHDGQGLGGQDWGASMPLAQSSPSRTRKYLEKRLLAGPNLYRKNPSPLGRIALRYIAKPSLPEGFGL